MLGAGYDVSAANGQQFNFISSYFTVPSINCAKSALGTSGAAHAQQIVGLGSAYVGTGGYCTSSGPATYYAFYQMYTNPIIGFSGVNPGDAIHSWASFNGSTWNLNVQDITNGDSLSTSQTCPIGSTCQNGGALVFTGDLYSVGVNLADFGMANYTNSAVAMPGIKGTLVNKSGHWTTYKITMVNAGGGDTLAVPSSLEGGKAFNITWQASQ